ncbi:MAG: DNA polymerase III subunit delta [candidate division Zixibacteria bacterium]|nr:DNA polymerase III subunit delta [candidate division Zixibacteria bacterium]
MATPGKLLTEIKAGRFKPAYYFFGVEDYRITEAEKFLARQFLPDLQLQTNYRRIGGKKTSAADLIAELATLPLLGERRVVAVSDFQSYKPNELKQILKMLSPPDPGRLVIFTSPSSKTPRKDSKFMALMVKATVTVEFKKLRGAETAAQISAKFKAEGLTIEADARALLTELVSGNRGGLDTEVAKLINYKTEGGSVTVEDVRAVSAGYEAYDIFELADGIIEGRPRTVLKMIKTLLAGGHSPVFIATLLQQHFTCLYLVKHGKKPLGNRAFLIPKFRRQAAGYDSHRLEQIIIEIARTDSEFRRGRLKPETALDMLAMNLAHEKQSGG